MVLNLVPGALVPRFFLAPHQFPGVAVLFKDPLQCLARKRIELLDTQDRDVIDAPLPARLQQVEIDLAAAKYNAPGSRRLLIIDLLDDQLQASLREILQRRCGKRVAQQALGRHHHQRPAKVAPVLVTQQVKELGGRARVPDTHVQFGTELQETLQAR